MKVVFEQIIFSFLKKIRKEKKSFQITLKGGIEFFWTMQKMEMQKNMRVTPFEFISNLSSTTRERSVNVG